MGFYDANIYNSSISRQNQFESNQNERPEIILATSGINFHVFLFSLFLENANATPPAIPHPCLTDAVKRAEKLLVLQSESEQSVSVSKNISVMKSLRNPANPKQRFDVLAITGFVYKSEYRMRFIYAQIPGQCSLVGQEILEFTSL